MKTETSNLTKIIYYDEVEFLNFVNLVRLKKINYRKKVYEVSFV